MAHGSYMWEIVLLVPAWRLLPVPRILHKFPMLRLRGAILGKVGLFRNGRLDEECFMGPEETRFLASEG